jgi:hypothetical protein
MMQSSEIRRLPHGTIDLDFYRTGATALRRQAMRDARELKLGFGVTLAMVAMLGFAAAIGAVRQPKDSALRTAGEAPRIERGTPTAVWFDRLVQVAKPTMVK